MENFLFAPRPRARCAIAWPGTARARKRRLITDMITDIGSLGGEGALVVIDAQGHVAFAMNSEGMYRGTVSSSSSAHTAIYGSEK